ncbi:hypothetical protein [Phocaeicola sp.]|uniref:hypothetical protein n=1 Tax=Phocaeicola sp. TaxID=2773926 RepID=UPI0023BDCFB1|nr:hypothetical protein [Phocaeicola sp.]MDE5677466.1 hypothetical protein [Phocaeicola sp.]
MKINNYLYLFLTTIFLFYFNVKVSAFEDVSKIVIDYDNPVRISFTIRDQHYGPIVVSGQTKVFGASFVQRTGETRTCDFRYAAFKDGKIVQVYDGIGEVTLENGKMHDIKVPCYIDLPEGDYTFYPIVRFKGETKWNMIAYMGYELEQSYTAYLKLHVYENYPAPSSEYMNFPDANGKGDSEFSVYHAYQNEKFRVQMKLVNKESKPLSGKIKIMWERNLAKFWRGMVYDATDVKTEWSICASELAHIGTAQAENGGIPISIEANGKLDIMIEDCFLREYYDFGKRWCPYLAAYFLPEGKEDVADNWLLINDNSDFCFDSDMNFISNQWDHSLNILAFQTFEGNVTGTEKLDITKIGLVFNKADGTVLLNNVPESSFVRVVDINNKLIEGSHIPPTSLKFILPEIKGTYIVSLYNYDGILVKLFRIIK